MALRWLAVDTVTGAVICHLPSIQPAGALRRTVGRYESQTVKLVVTPTTSPDWTKAVTEYQSMLIAYDGPVGSETVQWGGVVVRQVANAGNSVEVVLATPEAYLDRRYVGFYDATARDQNLIITDLVAQFAGAVPGLTGSFGLPLSTQVVGAAGTQRDRHYAPDNDKTIYSAINELSALKGGPQLMTTWTWLRNPDRITPVLVVGTLVGSRATPGLGPRRTFNVRGDTEVTFTSDYSTGHGANYVTAVGSGQGGTRPQQVAPASGTWDQPQRPVIEHRYSPAISINDVATLQAHADQARLLLKDGAKVASFTIPRDTSGFGSSWDLGDDVGYRFSGAGFPREVTGTAQCVGVEVTPNTVKPYLYTGVIY